MPDLMSVENLISAAAGSVLSGALARAFLSRALRSLDDAVTRINEILTELARVSVRLDTIEKLHDLIHAIDRRVISMEAKSHGKKHHDANGVSGHAP